MEVQGPLTWARISDFLRSTNLEITEDQLSEAKQEREREDREREAHNQGKLFDIHPDESVYLVKSDFNFDPTERVEREHGCPPKVEERRKTQMWIC